MWMDVSICVSEQKEEKIHILTTDYMIFYILR